MTDTTRSGLTSALCASLLAALAGCGGGGGGGDGDDPDLGIDDDAVAAGAQDAPDDPDGLPDFAVTDLLTAAATTSVGRSLTATVTITNEGTTGDVPGGWFLVSTNPDFVTDFHYVSVDLVPQTSGDDLVLGPGESGTYILNNQLVGPEVAFGLSGLTLPGAYYARFWLNPDLSVRALNSEDVVVESHATQELDYENNLSSLVAFESTSTSSCVPDQYEENDSFDTATPVALDTPYDFNSCDENYEVLSVDLIAGRSYELRPTEVSGIWLYTVVDPDGAYVTRNQRRGPVFTAAVDGTYKIAVTAPYDGLNSSRIISLEIVSR